MLITEPGGPQRSRLVEAIAAAPHLGQPAWAFGQVEAWLEGLAGSSAGPALTRLIRDHPAVMKLLAGLSEGAPFLWRLAADDPQRLRRLLECDPERHLDDLLAENAAALAAATSDAEVMGLLRRLKQEATLLVALLDTGGVWEVMRVTAALTALADHAVGTALRFVLSAAAADGTFRPCEPIRPENHSGYFVLAMGKMGALELNFSSDIDLMVFYDAAADVLSPGIEPTSHFVRLTRRLVKLLSERTPDGYVFRVDLRLRPDPASTQITMSTLAALNYYESVGQNWERAALIKARP